MKITLNQLNEITKALHNLGTQNLPLKGAFALSKLLKVAEEHYEFYEKTFTKIVDTYAERNEKGKPILNEEGTSIVIQKDKIEICRKELEELNSLEIELDEKLSITLADLGDANCSIQDLRGLSPVLRD